MGPTPARYKIPLNSEWNLPQRPLIGCGISTIWHAAARASLGESTLDGTGRLKNKAQRTRDLKRGYRGFKRVADSNGIPDTDDYLRIGRAMFPLLPEPDRLWTRSEDILADHLKAGGGLSIAVRLSIFGATNPIDFTRADHQVYIWGLSGGKVNVMGPMRKHSNTYHGHQAPFSAVIRAARAINDGTMLCWAYPKAGEWTAAALTEDRLRSKVRELRGDRNEAEAKLDRKIDNIKLLKARIAELEAEQPPDTEDCAPRLLTARLSELERTAAYLRERMEELSGG